MQRGRGKPARAGVAMLSVALALPAGVTLRGYYDGWQDPYPTVSVTSSPYIDGDPAEARLRRFVLTTSAKPGELRRIRGITEATRISSRQVAIATTMTRRVARALPRVAAVHRDGTAEFFSADPGFRYQWALENTGQTGGLAGADIRWSDTRGHGDGAGAVIAVIDSGIDFTHPDLAAAQWRNVAENCTNRADDDRNGYVDDCYGWDFVNNDNHQNDLLTATGAPANNDHGTHIAGTIAATVDNGVGIAGAAPGAEIMPLKVGENGSFPHSRLALAIDYAIANGAHVINASWGGSSSSSVLQAAIQRAHAAGVLFVAAAGNEGSNNDVSPRYPASYDIGAVVAVGASTHTDGPAVFSNFGATTVDLFAPGERILATLPGQRYGYMSGTSMAAPHVAAVAALVKSRQPGISLANLKSEVLQTAEAVAALKTLAVTGARLDAAAAIGVPEGGIQVAFQGFDGVLADTQSDAVVTVAVSDAGVLPANGEVNVRATLAVVDAGAARGVLAHPINDMMTDTQASVSLSGGVLSADRAAAMTSPQGLSLPVHTTLPPGQYAVMVELVDEAQGDGAVVGAPQAVLFEVADPNAPPPTPPPGAPTPADPNEPADPGVPGEPVSPGDPGPADPAPQPLEPAPGDGPAPGDDPPPGDNPPPADNPPPGEQPGDGPPPGHQPSPGDDPPDAQPPAPQPPSGEAPAPGEPEPSPPRPSESPSPSPLAPEPVPPPEVPPSPDDPRDPQGPAPSQFRVAPDSGPGSGGTLVEIAGEGLPAPAYVHFGASPAYVLYQDQRVLYVVAPAHLPGTVDIEIVRHDNSVVLPAAYTYLEDQHSPPPGVTQPPPNDTAPPGDPTSPPPEGTPPSPAPPGDEPPVTPPPDDQAPPAPDHGRMLGTPYKTARGLLVDSFAAGHPLADLSPSRWGGWTCSEARCEGIRL